MIPNAYKCEKQEDKKCSSLPAFIKVPFRFTCKIFSPHKIHKKIFQTTITTNDEQLSTTLSLC
jgi:hypothetical protein